MKVVSSNICRMTFVAAAALALHSQASRADENGVSLWLPGQFGSLAAAPAVPGWSLGMVGYHTSVGASGNVAAARQIQIGQVPTTANVNLNASLGFGTNVLQVNTDNPFSSFGRALSNSAATGGIACGRLDSSQCSRRRPRRVDRRRRRLV